MLPRATVARRKCVAAGRAFPYTTCLDEETLALITHAVAARVLTRDSQPRPPAEYSCAVNHALNAAHLDPWVQYPAAASGTFAVVADGVEREVEWVFESIN